MLCFDQQSVEASEQKRVSQEIEKMLQRDKEKAKREYKLLLLGTSASGKSTFIKQMRIIHGIGYKESDRKEFKVHVHSNVASAIKKLAECMRTLGIQYQHQHNEIYGNKMEEINGESDWMNMEYVDMIRSLWNDEGIQECYSRRNEYHLVDSAKYFLPEIDRIGSDDYIPTENDVLHVRAITTGIVEYMFSIDSSLFRIVDVGGQRTERRKWIHCFEHCSSIIFLTALSEYDQTLEEAPDQNCLEESTALFNVIINYDWFEDTSIILFLNKTDLLKEKVEFSNLEDYFPDYTGPKKDDKAARDFILSMFLELTEGTTEGRMTYSHFTCATDTGNIKFVFSAVKDIIMNEHLRRFHLI